MKVDYLIIGQGICGSFLSWNLWKEGKQIVVIDEARPFSSSKVASGVINPITGRRMVKTWMIDTLLPFAKKAYEDLGNTIGAGLVKQCDILLFHPNSQMSDAFEERYATDREYVDKTNEAGWQEYFHFNYGIGRIAPCLHIDLHTMLEEWRRMLRTNGQLREERFDDAKLVVEAHQVSYDDITAEKIIFCNGTDAYSLSYFDLLPFAKNKGEAILAEIPGLPATNIYKQGLSIVPWKQETFWVGSTYEWNYENLLPSGQFRKNAETQLRYWLKLPFTIVDHMAAERPATVERRPFVGLHPVYPSIGILNGMGTKGCSLAPFFAEQLTRHLVHGTPLTPEADVKRFTRVLSQRKA